MEIIRHEVRLKKRKVIGGRTIMEVLENEITYPNLDIQKLIKDKKLFDLEIIIAYIKEYKKGLKVKKISKTHKTGTRFTYIKINDDNELDEYKRFLVEMIREYNNKYNDNLTIDKIN